MALPPHGLLAGAPSPAGAGLPRGAALLALTRMTYCRFWTLSRTLQSMSPRWRRTWTFCMTHWTWRTPATAALTWRMTTVSSAPPSQSSGGHGHCLAPETPGMAASQCQVAVHPPAQGPQAVGGGGWRGVDPTGTPGLPYRCT